MQIALGSIFRNSTRYLPRYFNQVQRLGWELLRHGHTLRLVLVEGDSTDDTYRCLQDMTAAYDAQVIKVDHGGPEYGPIDDAQRWRNISLVCNKLLRHITRDDDIVIYVESDLMWEPETMVRLLHHLGDVDAVSPMCYGPDGLFYDIWGFRKNGRNFQKTAPFHHEIMNDRLTEIDSAGSCIVMRGAVARTCRFDPADQGIVGFCQNMRQNKYLLWLDSHSEVRHP